MRPKAASRGVPASGIWGPVLGSAPGQLEAGPLGGPQPASGVPLAAIAEHNQASTTEPRSLLARNLPRQPFPDPARSLSASYRGPLPFDAPSFAGVGPQLLEAQRGWQGGERRILEERPGLQALVPQRLIVLVEVLDGSLVRPQPLGRLAVLGQFDCDARHGANRTGSLHRERGARRRGALRSDGVRPGPGRCSGLREPLLQAMIHRREAPGPRGVASVSPGLPGAWPRTRPAGDLHNASPTVEDCGAAAATFGRFPGWRDPVAGDTLLIGVGRLGETQQ